MTGPDAQDSPPVRPPLQEQFGHSLRLGLGSQAWLIATDHEIDGDLVKPKGDIDHQGYLPMAFPKLPFELAAIKFGDRNAALKFVRQWGLLGFPINTGAFCLRPEAGTLRADGKPLFTGALFSPFDGEPLEFIWLHARQVRAVLELAKTIQDGDADALGDLLADMRQQAHPTCHYFWVLPVKGLWFSLAGYRTGGIYLDQDDTQTALSTIAAVISSNLEGVRPAVQISGDPRSVTLLSGLKRTFTWDALVQVIYWHLYNQIIEGGRPLAVCQECGGYFVRTDARQQFCPPSEVERSEAKTGLRSRAQSQCALRFRMRKFKQEKENKHEG